MRETTIHEIETTINSTHATVRIGSRANSPKEFVWARKMSALMFDT